MGQSPMPAHVVCQTMHVAAIQLESIPSHAAPIIMQIGQRAKYATGVEVWEQLFVKAVCLPHAPCITGETWKLHLQQTMRRSSNRA